VVEVLNLEAAKTWNRLAVSIAIFGPETVLEILHEVCTLSICE
jgi:hypothetical protein